MEKFRKDNYPKKEIIESFKIKIKKKTNYWRAGGRVVKAGDLRSPGAIRAGSNPVLPKIFCLFF